MSKPITIKNPKELVKVSNTLNPTFTNPLKKDTKTIKEFKEIIEKLTAK